jgi:hypothetical protein
MFHDTYEAVSVYNWQRETQNTESLCQILQWMTYTARYVRLHAVLQSAHTVLMGCHWNNLRLSLSLSSWRQTSASINFPTYVDTYLKYPIPHRSSYHVLHDASEFGSRVAAPCLLTHIKCAYFGFFLCSVASASLYNLVNETNLVHNIFCIFRQFYL